MVGKVIKKVLEREKDSQGRWSVTLWGDVRMSMNARSAVLFHIRTKSSQGVRVTTVGSKFGLAVREYQDEVRKLRRRDTFRIGTSRRVK